MKTSEQQPKSILRFEPICDYEKQSKWFANLQRTNFVRKQNYAQLYSKTLQYNGTTAAKYASLLSLCNGLDKDAYTMCIRLKIA